jgi:hypothetical protein
VTIATDSGGRQRTPTDGRSQTTRAATLAAHAATWLRDEQAACTANLAVGVYRAMAILLPLLVQAIASPIGRPAGPGPYLGWEQAMEGRVGKKKNIFLVWLVWPLITLGIYFFVWYYKVNREARDFDPEIDVAPAVSLLAVLIGWIIIIPPFVSIYRTGERIAKMQSAAGLEPTSSAIIGLLLTFAFHFEMLYYQNELNRIWDHYKNLPEGTPVQLAIPAA